MPRKRGGSKCKLAPADRRSLSLRERPEVDHDIQRSRVKRGRFFAVQLQGEIHGAGSGRFLWLGSRSRRGLRNAHPPPSG